MTEQAAARRMRILEELLAGREQQDISAYAREYGVDERTVRRDVDFLHEVVTGVSDVGLHRGRVYAERGWRGPGYFGRQVDANKAEKEQIARTVVEMLPDNIAIVLTAGSTTFHVARELRRSVVETRYRSTRVSPPRSV